MANELTFTSLRMELDARFGPTRADAFRKDLERLINSYSVDAVLNAPDWALADLMIEQLKVYARMARVAQANLPQNWSTR
jgi:hypothetical protein